MKIVLDVDDVLLDFNSHIHQLASDISGLNYNETKNKIGREHNLQTRFSLSDNQLKELWDNVAWDNLPINYGADKFLDYIVKNNFEIKYVTAIPSNFINERFKNLHKHFGNIIKNIKKEDIYCVGQSGNKRESVKSINPDFYIDDTLTHINECHDLIKVSSIHIKTGVLINNSEEVHDFTNKNVKNLVVINNISDAIDVIDNMLKKDPKNITKYKRDKRI